MPIHTELFSFVPTLLLFISAYLLAEGRTGVPRTDYLRQAMLGASLGLAIWMVGLSEIHVAHGDAMHPSVVSAVFSLTCAVVVGAAWVPITVTCDFRKRLIGGVVFGGAILWVWVVLMGGAAPIRTIGAANFWLIPGVIATMAAGAVGALFVDRMRPGTMALFAGAFVTSLTVFSASFVGRVFAEGREGVGDGSGHDGIVLIFGLASTAWVAFMFGMQLRDRASLGRAAGDAEKGLVAVLGVEGFYEELPIAYHLRGPDGEILRVSDLWCELADCSRIEALGRPLPAVLGSEVLRGHEARHRQGREEFETIFHTPTGRRLQITERRLRGKGSIGILVDPDEKERSRRKASDILRRRVTAALAGSTTRQVANSLAVARSNVDIAMGRANHEQSPSLRNARAALTEGINLCSRLLRLAPAPASVRRLDIGMVMDHLDACLRRALGPSIELEISVQGNMPLIDVAPEQLDAAIVELVEAARGALRDGGNVWICVARHRGEEGDVRIAVADDGVSMTDAEIEIANDHFSAASEGVRGSGLSRSHALAVSAQGRLAIERTAVGTTATLYLPQADTSLPPRADPVGTTIEGLTVLVAESDALLLSSMAELLSAPTCTVISTSSAEEALGVVRSGGQCDVVLVGKLDDEEDPDVFCDTIRALAPGVYAGRLPDDIQPNDRTNMLRGLKSVDLTKP